MTEIQKFCAATTKSGASCKNKAQPDSDYCYVHRHLVVSAPAKPVAPKPATAKRVAAQRATAKTAPTKTRPTKTAPVKTVATKPLPPKPVQKHNPQFSALVAELDQLANEIRAQLPDYTPPPFSPQALLTILKENLHRFTPELQLDLVNQLKSNLEETTAHDLIDPETWKGMWYILNYSVQSQSSTLKDQLASRLSTLPGVAWLSDLKENWEGTSPKDLLDVETWKGAWHVVNHSLKAQTDELKRKLVGDAEA